MYIKIIFVDLYSANYLYLIKRYLQAFRGDFFEIYNLGF